MFSLWKMVRNSALQRSRSRLTASSAVGTAMSSTILSTLTIVWEIWFTFCTTTTQVTTSATTMTASIRTISRLSRFCFFSSTFV